MILSSIGLNKFNNIGFGKKHKHTGRKWQEKYNSKFDTRVIDSFEPSQQPKNQTVIVVAPIIIPIANTRHTEGTDNKKTMDVNSEIDKLCEKYDERDAQIIRGVIEEILKNDFKDTITTLKNFKFAGNSKASIGLNTSASGSISNVTCALFNGINFQQELAFISKDDFVNILNIICKAFISNRTKNSDFYDGLYKDYLLTLQ